MTETVPDSTSTSEPPTEVPTVVDRPAQPYAAIRRQVTMAELGTTLPPLNERVFHWLTAQGAAPAGPPFWRYLTIDMATVLEVEVGVGTASLLAGDAEVRTGHLPAGRYAVLRHTGHPDSLVQATADLLAWAEAEGLDFDHHTTPHGDAWACRLELYETDPATEPDMNTWVTELAFRLAQ